MKFSIRALLIATAWVATSCVIGEDSNGGISDILLDARTLLTCTVLFFGIFNPKMRFREFWIGFTVMRVFLTTDTRFGLFFPDHYFDRAVMQIVYQLMADIAALAVGLAAHWGYVCGRRSK